MSLLLEQFHTNLENFYQQLVSDYTHLDSFIKSLAHGGLRSINEDIIADFNKKNDVNIEKIFNRYTTMFSVYRSHIHRPFYCPPLGNSEALYYLENTKYLIEFVLRHLPLTTENNFVFDKKRRLFRVFLSINQPPKQEELTLSSIYINNTEKSSPRVSEDTIKEIREYAEKYLISNFSTDRGFIYGFVVINFKIKFSKLEELFIATYTYDDFLINNYRCRPYKLIPFIRYDHPEMYEGLEPLVMGEINVINQSLNK